jgi:flagellin
MPTVINTNLASLFAQNSLSNAQNNLAQSVQRLSSGLRINSAKDDAAGLSISQNMQSQINGTNQSIRNLSDATNLLQVADSSLSTVQDMLLRLKQLATQGYDGSLSTSQKLNIVQEMKDLNNEINATAQRTKFNGINLLTSGSSIDLVNSDLKAGLSLSTATVTPAVASGTLADTANTKIGGGGTASTYTVALDSELIKYAPGTYTLTSNGNNLTLTGTYRGLSQSQTVTVADAVGNNLGGLDKTVNQSLDFSNFGIKLNTVQSIGAGATETGAQLASALAANSNLSSLIINGQASEITDVRLSGTAPGTYKLTYEATGALSTSAAGTTSASLTLNAGMTAGGYAPGALTTVTSVALTGGSGSGAVATVVIGAGNTISSIAVTTAGTGYKAGDVLTIAAAALNAGQTSAIDGIRIDSLASYAGGTKQIKLSGTVNGQAVTQSLAVNTGTAQTTQTYNFDSFGVQFDVTNYQTQSIDEIGVALANLNFGSSNGLYSATTSSMSNPGQIIVAQGNNSALKFQSGANSDAFIQIDTLNIQTGTTGATAGTAVEMMTLGTRISQTGAGNLGTLGALDTIDTWQTAFKNAAAAVDNALEFISTERAVYGSQMNRLSYVSTNLQAQSTNLQNSRSAIIDTDFAAETAKLTKGQIMQQAATAMLAQANQMPNVILSLLK